MVERHRNDGYSIFATSKQPDRQLVLDYMSQHGIYIVKSPQGMFFIKHLDSPDLEGFQRLTNYRAKTVRGMGIGIVMNDGGFADAFPTVQAAYDALLVLYEEARRTPGEDEF